MKLNNFEYEMLKVIAKYHRYSLNEIEYVYQKVKQFDKVITLINYADEFNRTLQYMCNLFLSLTKINRKAFEWINWAGQNNQLRDTIENTLKESAIQ